MLDPDSVIPAAPAGKPALTLARTGGRPAMRLFHFAIAAIYLAPLGLIKPERGSFVPSAQWQSLSLALFIGAAVICLVLIGAGHWLLVERIPGPGRVWKRLATGLVVILLPLWLYGMVYGVLRHAVDGPVLEHLSGSAAFETYGHTEGKQSHAYVLLRGPAGAMRFTVPETPAAQRPAPGDAVAIAGSRTWTGDTWDTVTWGGVALR